LRSVVQLIPAGGFHTWLTSAFRAITSGETSDVPCGTCTACCRSSQFVHIGPTETETLARIPSEILFPAPGLPAGNVLLGYDADGNCPMLVDDACSIYEDRPRTCRVYDCRIFTATGLDVAVDAKPAIAERVRGWEFTTSGDSDVIELEAVRSAGRYVVARSDIVGVLTTTQQAVLAMEIAELFIDRDLTTGAVGVREPSDAVVRTEVERRRSPGRVRQ
jgi:Fe-S-cluster containining protein